MAYSPAFKCGGAFSRSAGLVTANVTGFAEIGDRVPAVGARPRRRVESTEKSGDAALASREVDGAPLRIGELGNDSRAANTDSGKL